MAPQYKLTYFDIRGLAEASRFMLKYGGIDFVDDRIERDQWPQIKPSTPFGQMPIFTIGDKKYTQSIAIARYIAKQVKLTGVNDLEDLEIDSVVDAINDMRLKLATYWYENDPVAKEAKKATFINETLPYYLTRLDDIAKANNGHLACKRLTWADMYFAALVETFCFLTGSDILAKYPGLKSVKDYVSSLPAIKAWMETRPKSDF